MSAAVSVVGEPDDEPTRALIARLAREIPIDAFCEVIAQAFRVGPGSGEQTIEMNFSDGVLRWARVHSGKIGRDALDKLRSVDAPPDEG